MPQVLGPCGSEKLVSATTSWAPAWWGCQAPASWGCPVQPLRSTLSPHPVPYYPPPNPRPCSLAPDVL